MVVGGVAFALLGGLVSLHLPYAGLRVAWTGFGLASSLLTTPGGLAVIRPARQGDRPAVFAAHLPLSRAGWLGALTVREHASPILSGFAPLTAFFATRVWLRSDPLVRMHVHPDLPDAYPHLLRVPATGPSHRNRHPCYIDPQISRWSDSRA